MSRKKYCRCLYLKRRRRIIIFSFVVIVFLLAVFFNSEEPLTVSGISRSTHLMEERQPNQVLIHPKLRCMEHATKNTVIMLLSKASHSLQREAIRQTWGHPEMQTKYNFSLYFVLGSEEDVNLHEVDTGNEDVLHVDVTESYFHITEKVIGALHWVTHFCYESRYIFKIDDDVYFDVKFLQVIRKNEKYLPDNVILGEGLHSRRPFRMITKFRVSYNEYPFAIYPPYCAGPGYAMTLHTACKLYREMLNTKTFKFEDVYVGIVAYKLGISVKNVDNFVYAMDGYFHRLFIECAIITHNLTPDLIITLWSNRDNKDIGDYDCSLSGIVRYALFGVVSG